LALRRLRDGCLEAGFDAALASDFFFAAIASPESSERTKALARKSRRFNGSSDGNGPWLKRKGRVTDTAPVSYWGEL